MTTPRRSATKTAAPTSLNLYQHAKSVSWTRLDDPASLRPHDRESTATAELVPGALLDYTGTTARVDLIGQLLSYIRNTYFSYLDNDPHLQHGELYEY